MKSMASAGGAEAPPMSGGGLGPVIGAITLDAHGTIQDCDAPVELRFGFAQGQSRGEHLSTLFPELAGIELLQDGHLNDRLHYFCHIGKRFQALCRDGAGFQSQLCMTLLDSGGLPHVRVIVRYAS